MTPRVLILDLSLDPGLYRPTDHWRRLLGDVPVRSVRLAGGAPAPALGDATHVVVTGSEASIVEPLPWFPAAEAVVREAVRAGLRVLGSCFGHQLIARALFGPRHVRRAATPELGWFPVRTRPGPASFLGPPASDVHVFACHFDEVCDLPARAEVLGATADCAVHAFRLVDAPVWGVQAHPEIPPEEGAALLRGFALVRPDVRAIVTRALAGERRDDGLGARLTAAFLAR